MHQKLTNLLKDLLNLTLKITPGENSATSFALCILPQIRLDLQNEDGVNCNQKTERLPWWPTLEWRSSAQKRKSLAAWFYPVTHKWEVATKKGRSGGRGNYQRGLKGIQIWKSGYMTIREEVVKPKFRMQIWEKSFISRVPQLTRGSLCIFTSKHTQCLVP